MPEAKQVGINWQLANQDAANWARRYSSTLVTDIVDTTRDKIRRSVAGYVEGGETIGQLADRVKETGAFSDTRAMLIARTEVTASYAEGNVIAWKESGVTEGKMWNTRNDSLVCNICGPLDGVVVPIDGEFDGGIEHPPAHPGCRCWVTPRMLDDLETRADIDAAYGLERMPRIGVPSVPSVVTQAPKFTTVVEAQEWAIAQGIDADYTGFTADFANDLNAQLYEMTQESGIELQSITSYDNRDRTALGSVKPGTSQMSFADNMSRDLPIEYARIDRARLMNELDEFADMPDIVEDIEDTLKYQSKFVVSSTRNSVIDHEFAHALINNREFVGGFSQEWHNYNLVLNQSSREFLTKSGISRYGATSNIPTEAIAETFSYWKAGGALPRSLENDIIKLYTGNL